MRTKGMNGQDFNFFFFCKINNPNFLIFHGSNDYNVSPPFRVSARSVLVGLASDLHI
jgi:hypothetical protein